MKLSFAQLEVFFCSKAIEKRPGSIVSIASVVYHISRVLEDEIKINFICKGISHLLPNCMSQQFNVRLYSQVCQ